MVPAWRVLRMSNPRHQRRKVRTPTVPCARGWRKGVESAPRAHAAMHSNLCLGPAVASSQLAGALTPCSMGRAGYEPRHLPEHRSRADAPIPQPTARKPVPPVVGGSAGGIGRHLDPRLAARRPPKARFGVRPFDSRKKPQISDFCSKPPKWPRGAWKLRARFLFACAGRARCPRP